MFFLYAYQRSFFLFSIQLNAQQTDLPQLGKNTIKEVVAAMTPQEKAHLVVGMGMSLSALPASMSEITKDSGNKMPLVSRQPVDLLLSRQMTKCPAYREHRLPFRVLASRQ